MEPEVELYLILNRPQLLHKESHALCLREDTPCRSGRYHRQIYTHADDRAPFIEQMGPVKASTSNSQMRFGFSILVGHARPLVKLSLLDPRTIPWQLYEDANRSSGNSIGSNMRLVAKVLHGRQGHFVGIKYTAHHRASSGCARSNTQLNQRFPGLTMVISTCKEPRMNRAYQEAG